jgi:Kef-type K+ transport system membrane component KefB
MEKKTMAASFVKLTGTRRALVLAALTALALTGIGWVCLHLLSKNKNDWGSAILGALILSPGGLVAVVCGVLFSPQGGHGASDFAWMIAPATWLFYFGVSFLVFRYRGQPPPAL